MSGNGNPETSVVDIQNYFGERLSEFSWDRYKNVKNKNEFQYIKSKILYAFFGPPLIKDENAECKDSYVNGYNATQIKFMTPIYETICNQKKYSPLGRNICMSIIYVCVVPYDENQSIEDHYKRKKSDIITIPIFKVRKCIQKDLKNNKPSCAIYIDEYCRVYSDWLDFLDNNKLPEGLMMFFPYDGIYKMTIGDSNFQKLGYRLTPESKASAKLSKIADKVSMTTGLAAMGVIGTSLLFPVAAPLVVGATVASTSTAAYGLYSSGKMLSDRSKHEQTLSLSDPQARSCWITIVGSTAGVVSAGATKILTQAVRNGSVIGQPSIADSRLNHTMADRLTQLQDTINQQAEHFCNSIGILQQVSTPSKFSGFDRSGSQTPSQQQGQEDYALLFATHISRCAKDIDTLIESLPSEESSTELQVQSLRRLESENKESAEKLEEVVRHGEALLEKIQGALSDIAQAQLDMQNPNTLMDLKPQI